MKRMSENLMKSNVLLANEPNFVISSNLNAAKWIKGYVKEDGKGCIFYMLLIFSYFKWIR